MPWAPSTRWPRRALPGSCASPPSPSLLRYVVEKGSIAVDGVSLTVASVDDRVVLGLAHPRDAREHHPRSAHARARREPGGGCARQVRREADAVSDSPFSTIEEALEDVRAGPDGGGVRRRGPRERGRPHPRRPVRHARGRELHGQGGARPDLPRAHPGEVRRAGPGPDGGQERVAVPDRVHGLDRGARGDQHRDLRARPRAHDPGGDRPALAPAGPRPAGAHLPAEGEGGRRARAHRPDRGRDRPRPPGGPHPRRGDLRGDERRRHDGPGARPRALLRPARPEDDHRGRPDRLPPPARQAGGARGGDAPAHRLRRVQRGGLSHDGRRQAPRGDGQGRGRRRGRRARARALRVPHRRRVPLAALRLRPAARGRAAADRGGGPRRAAVPRPGGPRASAC